MGVCRLLSPSQVPRAPSEEKTLRPVCSKDLWEAIHITLFSRAVKLRRRIPLLDLSPSSWANHNGRAGPNR
jgi:hypothetical protein